MKNRVLMLLIALLVNGTTGFAQTWLWGAEGVAGLKTDVYSSNVATNKTGNVYQTGGYESNISFGTYNLVSPAYEDVFLVKYNQSGNVLWANGSQGGTYAFTGGYSVASDDSDNSYITGFAIGYGAGSYDTILFAPYNLYASPNGQLFLVKYNSAGKAMWATLPDTNLITSGAEGWAVTTDKFGHEYITGDGAFLIKYDRNGNILWTVPPTINDTGYTFNIGYSAATDLSGNIYVTGVFSDSLKFGATTLYSGLGSIFIAKYDSNGNVLWAQQSNNDTSSYFYYSNTSITTDKSGAAYLTAQVFYDTLSLGSNVFSSDLTPSFFVVKFNPNGNIAWANEANPLDSGGCASYSICADDSNHIYISGGSIYYSPVTSFVLSNDTVNIVDTTSYDAPAFLLKLDSSGKVLCSSVTTSGGNYPNGIAADSTGNFVYMGGTFIESFYLHNDYLTNLTGGENTYVGRWQSCNTCSATVNLSSSSISVCSGESVTLNALGYTNYMWQPSTALSATTGSSVVANPTVNTVYTVTGNDPGGCTAQAFDTITIIPAPNKPTITVSVTGDSLISSAQSYNQWFFDGLPINDSTRQVLVIKGHQRGFYKVVVTNPANGCTTTSDSTASINQLSVISEQLSIYPNPTSNQFTIISNQLSIKEITIANVFGQEVYKSLSGDLGVKQTIDVSQLPDGMYFITVVNKTGSGVVKVVKE